MKANLSSARREFVRRRVANCLGTPAYTRCSPSQSVGQVFQRRNRHRRIENCMMANSAVCWRTAPFAANRPGMQRCMLLFAKCMLILISVYNFGKHCKQEPRANRIVYAGELPRYAALYANVCQVYAHTQLGIQLWFSLAPLGIQLWQTLQTGA